jgi:hypothetical protein
MPGRRRPQLIPQPIRGKRLRRLQVRISWQKADPQSMLAHRGDEECHLDAADNETTTSSRRLGQNLRQFPGEC